MLIIYKIVMNRKGISPLIATVLLIALTMAIAGVMATWATGFVKNQIQKVEEDNSVQTAGCSGSLGVDARIVGGKGFAIVSIDAASKPLTNWTAYIFYDDPSKNENANMVNASITLDVGQVNTFNFTNNSAEPKKIRVSAGNCAYANREVDITLIS